MTLRELGRSGLKVSPLCFGGNVFGWTADEKTSFELLDAWVGAGFNFIDTADTYSRWVPGHKGGESEAVIGRWLAQGGGRRDKLVIATKVGMDLSKGPGLAPARIREAADESLKRLGVDRIDLYQAHQDDKDTPLEDTLGAFADLMKAGKVRAIGASNYTAPRLEEALGVSRKLGLPRYESLQPLYNLYDRAGFEVELQPQCVKESVGVINFYALAAGFLTGKYLNERGLKVLAGLDEGSRRTGHNHARLAIAWNMSRPGVTSPIVSATSLAQLEDIVQAARLTLDAATLEQLDKASAWSRAG